MPEPSNVTNLALLGLPVAHSLSPLIHETALAACGSSGRYVACAVDIPRFADAVRGLQALGFRGANVTIPHKERAAALCDTLSPLAQETGAVNTLSFGPDGLVGGDNTDVPGFLAPLLETPDAGAIQRAVVLGAGGAARSVVYALAHRMHLETIHVVSRRKEQAVGLIDAVGKAEAAPWPADRRLIERADLIVNATPIGLDSGTDDSPLPADVALRPGQVVYDLIYRPGWTRLLKRAASDRCHVIGGLPMLVQQAAASYRIWTGNDMDIAAVYAALAVAGFNPVLPGSRPPADLPADRITS